MAHHKNNSAKETIAFCLLLKGIVGLALWGWQMLFDFQSLVGYLTLSLAIFDFYLSYFFLKAKTKYQLRLTLRVILGALVWILVFLTLEQYGIFWLKASFLLVLALFFIKRMKYALLAFAAVALILLDGYYTAAYISQQQPLIKSINKYGEISYLSEEYRYRITAPANWKIIKKDNFSETIKSFQATEAEIALVEKRGLSFCLVIPSQLTQLLPSDGLPQTKQILMNQLKKEPNIKIKKTSFFIADDAGFKIHYLDTAETQPRSYLILYLRKNKTDFKFIVWTSRRHKDRVFEKIKETVKNISFKKQEN